MIMPFWLKSPLSNGLFPLLKKFWGQTRITIFQILLFFLRLALIVWISIVYECDFSAAIEYRLIN